MKRMNALLKISTPSLAALLALSACGQKGQVTVEALQNAAVNESANIEFHPSKIIGINPLIPVRADGSNIEASLRPYLDAFGIVALGNSGSCSGTHLGNGYVLTAGHCFAQMGEIQKNQPCGTTKVYWGYRGSPANGSPKPVVSGVSTCTKIIYAELSEARDLAIFQVSNPPKARVAVAAETARTAANTKLTIFGYPQGRPLEWSQYCPLRRNTVITYQTPSASRMAYQCDTEPGNSGSSVIAISPSGPKVVGVHNAAAPDPIKYNIATYMFDVRQVVYKQTGVNLNAVTGSIR
jgi:V8-like Glu-specific endopeptidase